MTYALSEPLQAAVFSHLMADTALSAVVGDAIYDAVPPGPLPALYVTLGAEEVRDASDMTGRGAVHLLTLLVVSTEAGFHQAKRAATAISDALIGAALELDRGRLVSLTFVRAKASRVAATNSRQIKLIFRARVSDA